MADPCPLCERPKESDSEFCNLHNIAVRNLENSYATWSKAFGGILDKDDYFSRLIQLPETGRLVKDLIQHIRGKGEPSR